MAINCYGIEANNRETTRRASLLRERLESRREKAQNDEQRAQHLKRGL